MIVIAVTVKATVGVKVEAEAKALQEVEAAVIVNSADLSSSKDGSDVDVDIMSEGEKEELMPNSQAPDLNLSSPGDRGSNDVQEIDILGDQ